MTRFATNRLKKHAIGIEMPEVTGDTDLALSRAGIEVTKHWMTNQSDDLTAIEILDEIHNLITLAVTDPLIRARLITFINILKTEEAINNG